MFKKIIKWFFILHVFFLALFLIYINFVYVPNQLDLLNAENKKITNEKIKKNVNDAYYDRKVELYNLLNINYVNNIDVSLLFLDKKNMNKNYIGHLFITGIDVDMPIYFGATYTNMLKGVGTVKKHQNMGVGNYALASHFHKGNNFHKIKDLTTDDLIFITDKKMVYVYNINQMFNSEYNNYIPFLDKDGLNQVTLTTCVDEKCEKLKYVSGDLKHVVPYDQLCFISVNETSTH